MSGTLPPLPPGFALDGPAPPPGGGTVLPETVIRPEGVEAPPLPPGFVLDGAPAAAPAQRTLGQEAGRQAGLTARMALNGPVQVLDMLNNAGAAILNAPFVAYDALRGNAPGTSEPFQYGTIGRATNAAGDALGLPRPEGTTERVVSMAGEGMLGNLGPTGAAMLATRGAPVLAEGARSMGQTVLQAFANSPAADAVGGALGGAAQQAVQEGGGGAVGQMGANLGGNIVGATIASAVMSAIARRRIGPNGVTEPIMPDPRSVTPNEIAGVADEVADAYRAQGFSDTDIRQAFEAFSLAEAQRQRMSAPNTRDTQPAGVGTAPDGTPVASSPRMAQDFMERSVSPRDPELPRAPDAPVELGPRQSYRYTEPDPNTEFPGAGRPPAARTPFPENPTDMFRPLQRPEPPPAGELPRPIIDVPPDGPTPPPPTLPEAVRTLRQQGVPEAEIRAMSPQQRIEAAQRRALPAPEQPATPAGSDTRAALGELRRRDADARRFADGYEPDAEPPPPTQRQLLAATAELRRRGVPEAEIRAMSPQQRVEDARTVRSTAQDELPGWRSNERGSMLGAEEEPDMTRFGRGVSSARNRELQRHNAADQDFVEVTGPRQVAEAEARGDHVTADAIRERIAERRQSLADGRAELARRQPPANDVPEPDLTQLPREARRLLQMDRADERLRDAERRAFDAGERGDTEATRRAQREANEWEAEADRLDRLGPPPRTESGAVVVPVREAGISDSPIAPPRADTSAPRPDGPGTTLYANPLDPAAFRRFVAQPAVRGAVRAAEAARSANLNSGVSTLVDSVRGGMFAIRDANPNAPEIARLVDELATDPGSGRVIRGTYQTEVTTRSQGAMNRIANILGRGSSPGADRAVRDALTGQRATPEVRQQAQRIRKILDDHHEYLRRSGVDVGRQENYFPRQFDEQAILADRDGFLRAAAEQYHRAGASDGEARVQAQAFLDQITGLDYAHWAVNPSLSTSAVKGRRLPASADEALAPYLITDPRQALATYLQRTTRLAEFTRRFGKNGEKAAEMFGAMARQGVPEDHIAMLQAQLRAATGTLDNGTTVPRVAALAGWIQTIGVVARLTGATISSLPEALAVGARTGMPLRGAEALVDMFRSAREGGSMHADRQIAEWLGLVGVTSPETTLVAQNGLQGSTNLQNRIMSGLFRMNGLQALTDRQRIVATRHGALFVRQMVDEIAGNAPTARSASRLMADLGMDEPTARSVATWLRTNPNEAALVADTPPAQAWRTAVTRFVNETIQNPEPVDKPLWSSHPIGRLAYGITSFQYAFTRNVLYRAAKQGGEALNPGNGMTLQDRLRLAGPLAGIGVLMAAQAGVAELRDRLGNSRQRRDRDPLLTQIATMDRMGVFGNLSPAVNVALSARYETDPSSRLTGPYVSNVTSVLRDLTGLIPQPLGPNSPRTSNAENKAARTVYSSIVAPAVIASLAAAPLPAPARAAAGVGAIAATRPDVSRAAADAVAGPVRQRQRGNGAVARY